MSSKSMQVAYERFEATKKACRRDGYNRHDWQDGRLDRSCDRRLRLSQRERPVGVRSPGPRLCLAPAGRNGPPCPEPPSSPP